MTSALRVSSLLVRRLAVAARSAPLLRTARHAAAFGPGSRIAPLAWLGWALLGLLPGVLRVHADEFRIRLPQGGEETLEARLVGSGQGALVLELADGQIGRAHV